MDGLAPGVYLLALNKPGYQVLLAQVNTRLLSLLRMRVPTDPPPGTTPTPPGPESMDWVLRLGRSDALKKVRAALPRPSADSTTEVPPAGTPPVSASLAGDGPPLRLPFQADVSQWFSASPPIGRSGRPETSGRETALQVLGDLPGSGTWQLQGLARNLNTAPGADTPAREGEDQGANRLRIGVRYDLNPAVSLRMAARYDRDRFRTDSTPASVPLRQEVRTLGYEALWARRMDEGRDLELAVGFVEAQGTVPGEGSFPEAGAVISAEGLLRDRRWNAGARYDMNPAPDHQLRIAGGMNVYRQDVPEERWILAPVQSGMGIGERAERGWTLSVSGEDAWKVTEPLSMIFAVDCHFSEEEGRSSILLPRLGVRHEGERLLVQGALMVRADAGSNGAAPGRGPEPVVGSAFGYRAEVEHRVDGSWILGGHLERNPFSAGAARTGPAEPGEGNPAGWLWIDPAAITDEVGILVRKRLGGVDGTLESDHGKIRGWVGGDGSEAPILSLGDGEVQYLAVKATASVDRSETRVHLDYRRYDGSSALALAGGPSRLSRMDVEVHQALPFLRRSSPADWRLLFGYQDVEREAIPASSPGTPQALDRMRRLSGGVGVRF